MSGPVSTIESTVAPACGEICGLTEHLFERGEQLVAVLEHCGARRQIGLGAVEEGLERGGDARRHVGIRVGVDRRGGRGLHRRLWRLVALGVGGAALERGLHPGVVGREREPARSSDRWCGVEQAGRFHRRAGSTTAPPEEVDPFVVRAGRVAEHRDRGVVAAARALRSTDRIAFGVAGLQVRIGVARVSGDGVRRLTGFGVEVATEDPHRVGRRHPFGEGQGLAGLARVHEVVGLARRRAHVGRTRAVVATRGQVRRDEVHHPDIGGDPHPQRSTKRTRESLSLGAEHRQCRQHDLAIEAFAVVPHQLVASVAHIGHRGFEEHHHVGERLLDADQFGAAGLSQLLHEQRDTIGQVAAIAVGRARQAVQHVLTDHPNLSRRSGARRRVALGRGAVARTRGRHDEDGEDHSPEPTHAAMIAQTTRPRCASPGSVPVADRDVVRRGGAGPGLDQRLEAQQVHRPLGAAVGRGTRPARPSPRG